MIGVNIGMSMSNYLFIYVNKRIIKKTGYLFTHKISFYNAKHFTKDRWVRWLVWIFFSFLEYCRCVRGIHTFENFIFVIFGFRGKFYYE